MSFSGFDRCLDEMWSAKTESLCNSESQRGHFQFSSIGVAKILRNIASDLVP